MSPGRALAIAVLLGAAPLAAAPPPPGAPGKLDSTLRELSAVAAADPAAARAFAGRRQLTLRPGPEALVVIETAGAAAAELAALTAAGARVEQTAGSSALAFVPLARLTSLAALPAVLVVRRPVRAQWSVTSEGVALIGAPQLHDQGVRGDGVRIGIIDSFQNYEGELGGELPPRDRVTFRSFIGGGGAGDSDHGVQVAEIITDVAPDADLFLAAIDDDAGYRNAVDWLLGQGVRVINHSGGFGLFGDMKGSGPIHDKVAQAFAANVLYVEAAGNNGRSHWEGTFRDQDGDGFHEFAAGVERITFTADAASLELRVDLTWDDWRPDPRDPRPTTDYDVCLYDGAGNELACARDPQSGQPGQLPFEVVQFTAPSAGEFAIGVQRRSGGDLFLEVALSPNYDFGSLAVERSSLIVPADHPDAFTIGATSLTDVVRPYSGRGPTNDGRLKPELVAPDGVITSRSRFFGTSAAAPHVAGAAALLLSRDRGLGAGELRDRLRNSAVQSPADPQPGADSTYGSGRLQAAPTGAGTPTPTATPTATPRAGGGGGGGGCRVVGPEGPAAGVNLLLALAAVLAYGRWRARRS